MKKVFLVFLLFLIFQNMKGQKNEIGQETGISISSVDWTSSNTESYSKKIFGLTSGFKIGYLNHKYWNLNSGLYYAQRGGCEQVKLIDINGIPQGEETSRFEFNYLTINTTFNTKYQTKVVNPCIFVGPRFDFLISSTITSKEFNKINYGVDFG
ncbi:MAG: outer membrane beta-barrel protein [Paludibacter sp.]